MFTRIEDRTATDAVDELIPYELQPLKSSLEPIEPRQSLRPVTLPAAEAESTGGEFTIQSVTGSFTPSASSQNRCGYSRPLGPSGG